MEGDNEVLFYVTVFLLEISLITLFFKGGKILKVITIPFILLIGSWSVWSFINSYQTSKYHTDISKSLMKKIEAFSKSTETELLLHKITPFKWNFVCDIQPYNYPNYPVSKNDIDTYKKIGFNGLKEAYNGEESPKLIFKKDDGELITIYHLINTLSVKFKNDNYDKKIMCYTPKTAILVHEK